MAVTKRQQEPSLKDQLLADYDRLEDQIEDAAQDEIWELADWLAQYVPNNGRTGRPREVGPRSATFLTIQELAQEGRRSERQLRKLRQVAEQTKDDRLDDVAPRTYMEALRKAEGNLAEANKSLQKNGKRLRDQADNMESTKALVKQILKKSKGDKEQVARAIYRDIGPVTILDDEPDDYEQEDIEPEPIDPEASQTLRESYASCVTSTVEQHIDAIEGALKYLFETDMYKISKKDRARLRNILQKGLDHIDG